MVFFYFNHFGRTHTLDSAPSDKKIIKLCILEIILEFTNHVRVRDFSTTENLRLKGWKTCMNQIDYFYLLKKSLSHVFHVWIKYKRRFFFER